MFFYNTTCIDNIPSTFRAIPAKALVCITGYTQVEVATYAEMAKSNAVQLEATER